MDNPSFKPSRRFLLVLLAVAALVLAGRVAAASAATYCVKDPACPAGGVAEGTVAEALAAADEDVALDTVRIGPGTFHSSSVSASKPVEIVGSGSGTTTLEDEPSGVGTFVYLTAGCKITDLSVRLTKNGQEGLRLAGGADVARVAVSASHSLKVNSGIFTEGNGSDISSVTVDLGPEITGYAIGDLGESTTIEDADLTGAVGLLPSKSGTVARRLTIHAHNGLFLIGGVLNLANALILPYPDTPHEPGFQGVEVTGGNEGANAVLAMADTTIVGPGAASGGLGIDVESNNSVNSGTVTASLQGVVIAGVAHSIYRHGKSATQTATVSVAYSAYDGARVTDGPGNGELSVAANNLTGGADPRFVDPAAGDYRPRYDSPLLDVGPPMMPLAGDDPDLSGRSRVRDSDGNGSAVRDIGAYEYQRLAPVPALAIAPQPALSGALLGFDSAASADPDGDPISFAWSFGDGAAASGPSASHAYGSPGVYGVSLTATDATGLSATATGAAAVVAPPPPASDPPLLSLVKVKRKPSAGTATVFASVSGPGSLALSGKQVRRRTNTARGAGLVALKLVAKGAAARALRTSGRARVRFVVTFAAAGGTRTATRTVTLRLRPH